MKRAGWDTYRGLSEIVVQRNPGRLTIHNVNGDLVLGVEVRGERLAEASSKESGGSLEHAAAACLEQLREAARAAEGGT